MARWPSVLVMTIALVQGCGSGARQPTLPAPEFEPPVLSPWDAGAAPPTQSAASEPNSGANSSEPVEAAPVLPPGSGAPADTIPTAVPGNDAASPVPDAGP